MSLGIFAYGLSLSLAGFPKTVLLNLSESTRSNPGMHASRFGLFPFRSPLLWKSINFVFFLRLLRCFSSPGSPPNVSLALTEVSSAGFPHSDISGSKDMCSSPKLFAAYHVFHRLLVPRHPPCALSMTNLLSFTGMNDRSLDSYRRFFTDLFKSVTSDGLYCL